MGAGVSNSMSIMNFGKFLVSSAKCCEPPRLEEMRHRRRVSSSNHIVNTAGYSVGNQASQLSGCRAQEQECENQL